MDIKSMFYFLDKDVLVEDVYDLFELFCFFISYKNDLLIVTEFCHPENLSKN